MGGHGLIIGLFLIAWRWADKHVKYFKARLNGYTIEKKEK